MIFELAKMPLYKSIHLEEFREIKTEVALIRCAADLVNKCPPADLLLAAWRHCCLLDLPPVVQQRIINSLDSILHDESS